MCGRFALIAPNDAFKKSKFVPAGLEGVSKPRYNIAPSQPIQVIHSTELCSVRTWGLPAKNGQRLINARAETIDQQPVFKSAFVHGRCVVPASWFYEWDIGYRPKWPYKIAAASGALMHMAAIQWPPISSDDAGYVVIVTVPAHPDMLHLHDRMPLLLDNNGIARWLDPLTTTQELRNLMQVNTSYALTLTPVHPRLNDARQDNPHIFEVRQPPPRLF